MALTWKLNCVERLSLPLSPVPSSKPSSQKQSGLLCHTLADYCHGVQLALEGHFDRRYIRERAQRYDMYEVAKQYDYAFRCLADLRREGWYAPATHL